MRALVVMPLKRAAEAKPRLAEWFAPRERRVLQRAMAADVIAAVRSVRPRLELAIVAEDAREARDLLGACGTVVGAPRAPGLNAHLAHAVALLAAQCRAARALVLPADLPAVGCDDVAAMLTALDEADLALAPDRHGTGTNALAFGLDRPPRFAFGRDSAAGFVREAERAGRAVRIVQRAGLALDVDDVADVRALVAAGSGGIATRRALVASGFADRGGDGGRPRLGAPA